MKKIYYCASSHKDIGAFTKIMDKNKFIEGSGNTFADVGFDEVEAKNLKFRSHLMTILVRYIQEKGFTQKDAAKELHVSQPRISNLLHGKIDLFSVGMLLDMMERAGFQIYKKMQADTSRILNQFQRRHHHV